ncbi:MAG: DUF421 domain-containing protein [Desulfobacteraceae bacterium]|nr:MAG: DUF421 domain-containing protein [Desulfobacteraceae bacterium]
MGRFIFDDWSVLLRTAVIGILAYIGLVLLLRLTGKRTLSKMNAFDFVVTVALGSTLASILLSRDVTLSQGVLALALLIFLQFAITWSSVRVSWIRSVVTGEPLLILYQGEFQKKAMLRSRVTEDEVRAAVRSSGLGDLLDVEAVILETDGSFSVIRRGSGHGSSGLAGVKRSAD